MHLETCHIFNFVLTFYQTSLLGSCEIIYSTVYHFYRMVSWSIWSTSFGTLFTKTVSAGLHFTFSSLPIYKKETIIPNTNKYGKIQDPRWNNVDFDEVLHVLGLLIAMEGYKIHGSRRFYWSSLANNLFPSMYFGNGMTYQMFEIILKYIQLCNLDDEDQEILDFLAVIKLWFCFQNAITPGTYLTLYESMIKSFH